MKPEYISKYIKTELFDKLMSDVPWLNKEAPRDECFMSLVPMEYTYGNGFTRTYKSVEMIDLVKETMNKLNSDFNTSHDICFLNFYKSEKEHLGWHADDSPEMDENHPIGVISFGAERFIWCKDKNLTGNIPNDNKYLLENGSLFTMPAGYQKDNLHRIPKNDRPCGGRISLTFRKYKSVI